MKFNGNQLSMLVLGTAAAMSLAMSAVHVSAEIPPQSKEELHGFASHALVGKVARTYERKKRTTQDFEYTYGVAEISVDKVCKGSEIAEGDRIFVRYWRRKWIGTGLPLLGHYGHWDIPKGTDTVVVYVKGDRKTGFDVLSPNGFFKVTKTKAKKAQVGPATGPESKAKLISNLDRVEEDHVENLSTRDHQAVALAVEHRDLACIDEPE